MRDFGFHFNKLAWFIEGESHSPTLKSALIFNLIRTTRRSFALCICRKLQKQTSGKIYEILSCWKCALSLGQFTPFLGTFSLNDLSFFFPPISYLSSGHQILYLNAFILLKRQKQNLSPTLILWRFSFGKLHLIK